MTESDVVQTSHPLFWFPLKLRYFFSGPSHDTGVKYSFPPVSTLPSAVPSSGTAKASRPVSGPGAPLYPSAKPQARRLPHPDGLTEFPRACAPFSELLRIPCRTGNCLSPHLPIWKSIPVPPERPIPPPAHKPRRTMPAQQRKGISSSGIQRCAFKLTYGKSRKEAFSRFFPQSPLAAACFRWRYCLRPFLGATPDLESFPAVLAALRLVFSALPSVFPAAFLAGYFLSRGGNSKPIFPVFALKTR